MREEYVNKTKAQKLNNIKIENFMYIFILSVYNMFVYQKKKSINKNFHPYKNS